MKPETKAYIDYLQTQLKLRNAKFFQHNSFPHLKWDLKEHKFKR